ncbi:MAG: hypothetical protein L3J23_03030 [Flavobacteriaceae bacterium]|nr:hypothetical protein [Flavobacteriaceae bacterium]
MSLSGIKLKAIIKKTEKLLKRRNEENALEVSSRVNTVGIIVDEGSKFNFESLKELQKNIASDSTNFHVLTCKNTTDNYNEFRGVSFNEKDFSWNGTLKSKEVNFFLESNFDMLIDYTKSATIYKKYLVAKSNAKFKVGYAAIDNRLFDFMIAVENEKISQFNKELIKYLKILNKI